MRKPESNVSPQVPTFAYLRVRRSQSVGALIRAAPKTLRGADKQCTVFPAVVDAQAGEITSLYTYSEYGGGDVIVTVQAPNGNCAAGYWLRMSDPGAKTMYAQLLSAYHAKARLRIQGHDDQIWGGSGGRYCRIYGVGNVP